MIIAILILTSLMAVMGFITMTFAAGAFAMAKGFMDGFTEVEKEMAQIFSLTDDDGLFNPIFGRGNN